VTKWFPFLLLFIAPLAQAQTADEILDQAQSVRTVERSVQRVKMVLVSKSGAEREREMAIRARRDGEVLKSLIRFESPSDVAGTTFLQLDDPQNEDEQMLYLPALRRVNRISGSSRKGSFMGSDFSYEDLELSPSDDAKHTVVETTDTHWVIDSDPGSDSSYGRIRATVLKDTYLVKAVTFFNDDDEAVKELEVTETQVVDGKTLARVSVMKTLKRKTATRLEVMEQRLDVPAEELPEEMFTKAYLERGS